MPIHLLLTLGCRGQVTAPLLPLTCPVSALQERGHTWQRHHCISELSGLTAQLSTTGNGHCIALTYPKILLMPDFSFFNGKRQNQTSCMKIICLFWTSSSMRRVLYTYGLSFMFDCWTKITLLSSSRGGKKRAKPTQIRKALGKLS